MNTAWHENKKERYIYTVLRLILINMKYITQESEFNYLSQCQLFKVTQMIRYLFGAYKLILWIKVHTSDSSLQPIIIHNLSWRIFCNSYYK